MKYEAKIQGISDGNQTYSSSYVPESRASGTPWVNISQTNAISECASLGGNYRLMTNAEWTSIARNIESVNSNWSEGSVGSGYLSRGFSASTTEAPGIDTYTNTAPAPYTGDEYLYNTGANQVGSVPISHVYKRTSMLSNGQAIWDIAGNVWEWTSSTCSQGSGDGYWYPSTWIEWSDANLADYEKPFFGPSSNYTSSSGVGKYYGCNVTGNAVARGGYWNNGINSGVFSFNLNRSVSIEIPYIGFRCIRAIP
jgi:formylglycine-generating enzyme required for sulfatase activity